MRAASIYARGWRGMQGEEGNHRRELLAAHFEKLGSTETERAVVQRYSIHGLQGAEGIVAWPRRGETTRVDGRQELLDGCWVLSTRNTIVLFNPRTARQLARNSRDYERGTWAGLELLAGGGYGYANSAGPRVRDEDGEWTSSAQFKSPEGVAVDGAGNVVVVDTGSRAIRSVSRNGVVHTLYQYERPSGPPVPNEQGILLQRQCALPGRGCLSPHGVCVLRDGSIVVSHVGVAALPAQLVEGGVQLSLLSPVTGRVPSCMSRSSPRFERLVSTPRLRGAMGLATDNDGNIVVADHMENRLARVTREGVSTVCGGEGGGGICFDKPTAVVVDRHGAMIVADWQNGRLRKVTERDGEVRVTALDWEEDFPGAVLGGHELDLDGQDQRRVPYIRLPFKPFALALDTEGRLLVLDSSYPSDVLVVDYSGGGSFRARREREEAGRSVPRVRFNSVVGYREATLLQMQAALALTGVRSGGSAGGRAAASAAGGGAAPLTLLDLPASFWDHTDESALKLLGTSKSLRLALARPVPGAAPGKPTVRVRLNRAWYDALGSAPRRLRKDTVLAELARTSQVYSITTLELRNIPVDGTEAALATAISRSTALTRLSLSECRINAAGCRRIAEALLPCQKLAELDLGQNELGAGVGDVADVLPRLPALKDVTLNRCGPHYASEAAAERLALALPECTALTSLNLQGLFGAADDLGFRIEPVIAALPRCTALAKLCLSMNTCDSDAEPGGMLGRSLARMSSLTDLELLACGLNDETMQQLGATHALTGLTRLSLANNPMREAGARSLGQTLPECRALRELNLSKCGNFENLRALGPGLAACPLLRRLELNSLTADPAGCRVLLAALRESSSLTELHMERMQMAHENRLWSVACGFAEVLGAWPTLRKLDLEMSGVRDAHLIALLAGDACTALRDLNVSSCKIHDAGGLALAEALPRLTALTRLNVSCSELREQSVLALLGALPACTSLTSLDLYATTVAGDAWRAVVTRLLEVLPRCPWLRELDVRSHFRSMILPREAVRLRAAWLLATGQEGPRYDSETSRGNHEFSCAGLRLTVFTGST